MSLSLIVSCLCYKACQFLDAPTTAHMALVKRIIRYLKATLYYGLLIQPSTSYLNVFCDMNWASCSNEKKSTSGFEIFLGTNIINWTSKKQHIIARLSTEVEMHAIILGVTKLLWTIELVKELKLPNFKSPIVCCDKIPSIYLIAN